MHTEDPLQHLQSSPPPMEVMESPEPLAARTAQVANPTPVHLPTRNHPPYAEMITTAISALNETNGSSRHAIAKYIDQVYSDLPPTHSSLLTHHLKRLKNIGQLVMVKHSYKLLRSPTPLQQQPELDGNGSPITSTKRKPGRPPKLKPEIYLQPDLDGNGSPTTSVKRKPGRPPKLKPEIYLQPDANQQLQRPSEFQPTPAFQQQPPFHFQPEHVSQFQIQEPDHPQFEDQPFLVTNSQNVAGMEPESVFASLGLVDPPTPPPHAQASPPPTSSAQPTKRGPGRPKKISLEDKAPAPSPQPGVKRGPGRPPKDGLTGVRSPGRPPKSGRSRGRPKRNTSAWAEPPKPTIVATPMKLGRPRGRPAKNAQFGDAGGLAINVPITDSVAFSAPLAGSAHVAGASNAPVTTPRQRGRPPGSYAGGYKKAQKLSGRSPGRPRKNAPIATPVPTHIPSYSNNSALQGELEQLKSRIKETASVIRPFLNSEIALTALQNLEAFAANDV